MFDDTEDLLEKLEQSIHEVLQSTIWQDPIYLGIEEVPSFSVSNKVTGLIRFHGSEHPDGMIGISMSKAFTAFVVSKITGLPEDDFTEDDLLDGAAELTNMIAGRFKSSANFGSTSLSPPVAIIGTQFRAIWKTRRSTIILTFQVDNELLQVHASF
ncbi:MAG: chemotaxis protein CheX [Magnetococcales bacterium]|nr:chemotaxis protein CheX [Magnetococcales bacterium]